MRIFGSRDATPDEPLSAEMFSVERLEQYASILAREQEVSPAHASSVSLHSRLRDNAAILRAAHQSMLGAMHRARGLTPAAKWLIDNYYVVDQQIRAIRRDLPLGFYRQLPKLARGHLRGYPRVYGLAWTIVAHSDNRFELDTLQRFCRAYQRVQPLTIGELWAISITLRVVLIDNLRRLAAGIVHRLALRDRADALADALFTAGPATGGAFAGSAQFDAEPLPNAFSAQLFQRLRDQDPATTPALLWLQTRLAAQHTNPEEIVHGEHQRQGAVNASVSNVITSLRLISAVDWAKFFEGVSLVDEFLREHSAYRTFDFPTRDLYRHAIEELARGSTHSELEVARRALGAAQRAGAPASAKGEVGYYLIAAGRAALERELGHIVPWHQRWARWTRAGGLPAYAGSIGLTSAVAVGLCWRLAGTPASTGALSLVIGGLVLVAVSETAVTLANLWVTRRCTPLPLPALELLDGVPADLRTLIVLPVLLTAIADIEAQVNRLEVHFLATHDGEIHFALLSDWRDAASETDTGDAELLAAAARGIARLNRIYANADGVERFLLLHRGRRWNEAEGRWMGWERKRGKLHELNALLLGGADTSFIPIDGRPPRVPQRVRYVISLDADTQLPRGAALALIGKMAHPLNRPVVDPATRRVIEGYGILQPRVTPALAVGLDSSVFQGVFSGPSGIDPYAFAVSDVYQDLFGEGSYTGKGIYDLAAFETSLEGRVGDNRLLSHDLFEGIFARCGLASDVEVVEEYPARYDVAAARNHRWTRGDWQLLPWLVRRGSGVPALGRWKIFDNLRRSASSPASVLALVVCWVSGAPPAWTLIVFASMVLPILVPLAAALRPRLGDLTSRGYYGAARDEIRDSVSLLLLRLALWADQAWVTLDAVTRTLYRLGISRRHLLEWTTTAQSTTEQSQMTGVAHFYRRMAGGVLSCAAVAALLAVSSQGSPWIAAPFLLVWLCAPAVARWVSLPRPAIRVESLTESDVLEFRLMGRQTWSYFDTFVSAEQNMLPPDNFQEVPNPVIAHRTSPTNIGLYLLSVVCARDMSWIGSLDALDRLEATFATLDRMQRHRGHFFNWYDTQDLRPLDPAYISTVDSGNLAGHLLAVASACRAWTANPPPDQLRMRGIDDTLERLQRVADAEVHEQRNYGVSPRQLASAVADFRRSLHAETDSDLAARLAGLAALAADISDIAQVLAGERGEGADAPLRRWADALLRSVATHRRDAAAQSVTDRAALQERAASLGRRARSFALAMEFGFLVDPDRQLLSIGFRMAERSRDPSCYDLLASEARLASFLAIAKGDLPVRHWFRLGRLLAPVRGGSALVSWSGSMFEYLMPVLVMREADGSVLGDTNRLIVRRQIEYGAGRGLPWGVSESAFNARDRELTYQYSSFGVPGLGLQRGLGEEAVIAPYATGLAAMVDPKAASRNFARLESLGGRGPYGWYDALDFTPLRLPEGEEVAPVRAYMAHHQGMILVSLTNVLNGGSVRSLLHDDPMIQATELLLQERTPRDADRSPTGFDEARGTSEMGELPAPVPRRFSSPHHGSPRTHLLSNGNYSVMITAAGSGYSRWRDMAVTRWREDPTCDAWGSYVFLRDVSDGQVWSAGYQPVGREPDSYDVAFFEDRAEFVRTDGPIVTTMEILVSPEDDAEVRRVSVTNNGNRMREIELTTYCEVVLTSPAADSAHPAFAKMFVQTEFVAESGVLLATRRTREPGEPHLWAAHASVLEGEAVGGLQYETDRARFLGRGHDLRRAVSIMDARPLSNTTGTVLDPVLALRRRIRVAPHATVRVAFWTLLAPTRAEALSLADKHRAMAAFDRAKTLSWTQAQVQLRYLGIDFDEAQQYQRIANRVLYSDAALRAAPEVLAANRLGPADLWAHGVSGDLPIVLIRIDDEGDLEIVRQLLRAHEYWRLKRLAVDLVILNERPPSYASELQHSIDAAIRTSASRRGEEDGAGRGSVYALRGDLMPTSSSDLLQTAARAVFVARRGSLVDQLARLREPNPLPRGERRDSLPASRADAPRQPPPSLEYFNGLGGFAAGGREYVTVLNGDERTPAPWVNVIANPHFGFQVSADGTGSTWSLNSREYQLTPWSNDPVIDTPSEAIYVRDVRSGELWSATPLPIRQPGGSYIVRHGFGYTRFEHASHGIGLELLQFVPVADSLKISRLTVVNQSDDTRQLSITNYVDWVLGNQRSRTSPFIVTEIEPSTAALLARNPWRLEFQDRVAFLDSSGRQQSCTADRTEFIGRHGSMAEPAALLGALPLSGRVGGGLDSCGALQTAITLRPGEQTSLVFLLGDAESREAAAALIERYRGIDVDAALKAVTDYWTDTLDVIQVKTPDRSIDIMLNGWLLYQTLVCRLWARSGFYQASGAYGFRDQLQDVMALCIARPGLAREHILRAGARQFTAGDVQHWWLPTSGQGVQTRISDNRIWLPFVVSHYMAVTADAAILDAPLPFLEGGPLAPDQHEIFTAPAISANHASLFEHCALALEASLAIGSHGLPLFGTGDWNDGMNRVGAAGRGESVWLGWFLNATLLEFAGVAETRGEAVRAETWRRHAFALQQAIEREAWDGDWYRRGYFDDGSPLGSISCDECRIDAIAQSWAVISRAGDPARTVRAMAAVNAQLVSRSDGLVKLFTPAFDHTLHDPGYVKAYPAGLRENGGQYTHAAMWTTLAFARMGDGDRAGELLSILNPINHASTRAGIHRYKVEPYVVCADVYSAEGHVGRGGWTWYTGSAAWMYRTAIEGMLGIELRGATLSIDPCIPRTWKGFEITYKHGSSRYQIAVENPLGVCRGIKLVSVDDREISRGACVLTLVDDGHYHYARVTMG